MADGKSRMLWRHTAANMCLLANINRDPKRKAYSPDQFDPHEQADRARRKSRMIVHQRQLTVAQLTDEIMTLSGQNGRR